MDYVKWATSSSFLMYFNSSIVKQITGGLRRFLPDLTVNSFNQTSTISGWTKTNSIHTKHLQGVFFTFKIILKYCICVLTHFQCTVCHAQHITRSPDLNGVPAPYQQGHRNSASIAWHTSTSMPQPRSSHHHRCSQTGLVRFFFSQIWCVLMCDLDNTSKYWWGNRI